MFLSLFYVQSLSKTPTGKIIKGNPELTLTLRVTKADGEQYDAEITRVMLAESAEKLNVGKVVDVLYLPQDPQSIVITSQSIIVLVNESDF